MDTYNPNIWGDAVEMMKFSIKDVNTPFLL